MAVRSYVRLLKEKGSLNLNKPIKALLAVAERDRRSFAKDHR